MTESSPSPVSSSTSSPSRDPADLVEDLSRAHAAVRDGLNRLKMAKTDARGDNHSLDAVDAALQGNGIASAEAGEARARKIAASVAEDLEAAAAQLRRAAQA